ncbi:MAG: PQQ-binding-like beta-propeller repeat protein, partial [Anaerolineales bacterium]
VTGSPIMHQNRLYFGSVDSFVYCLDGFSGNLIWKYQTNGAITSTPLINGNILYIGSTDKHLYALQITPSG